MCQKIIVSEILPMSFTILKGKQTYFTIFFTIVAYMILFAGTNAISVDMEIFSKNIVEVVDHINSEMLAALQNTREHVEVITTLNDLSLLTNTGIKT